MHITTQLKIVRIALDYLNQYGEMFEEYYTKHCEYDKLVEVEINSRLMFAPLYHEYGLILEKGKNGNQRTKQILTMALVFMRDCLDYIKDEYQYSGDNWKLEDTHISLDDITVVCPTEEDIEDILSNIDKIVKSFPPMPKFVVNWAVIYKNEEDEEDRDEIYCDGLCNSIETEHIVLSSYDYTDVFEITPLHHHCKGSI